MMNLPVSGNVTDLFGETSQRDLGGAGRGLPTVTIVAGDCKDYGDYGSVVSSVVLSGSGGGGR